YLAHRGLRLGGGSDKTESVFTGEITLCTGVFCNHGATQRQKSRGAIADPAGAPRHVNTLDCCELSKRAGEVAAVSSSRARDPVRIDNFPAEPVYSFSFGIPRSNVHRQLEPCFWNAHG